jgi:Domain of unknown function (DU1801)
MNDRPFLNPAVAAKYAAYAPDVRAKLLRLRELAFETAAGIAAVGTLVESLKWGQPSFSTPDGLGSTFRLDEVRNSNGAYALYFLCQTSLIEGFRVQFVDEFAFEGNRAIQFAADRTYSEAAIANCMAQAMNYYRKG